LFIPRVAFMVTNSPPEARNWFQSLVDDGQVDELFPGHASTPLMG
jgi:hypothetical protein